MKITQEQKKLYLAAIGFKGAVKNDASTLKKIVEGHIFAFPYETIAVHDREHDLFPKRRSNLKPEALFDKMVKNKRGGRCVELNVFLQTMLKEFGFNVTTILPETLWHSEDVDKEDRAKHSAAIVKIGRKKYLIDAGFGGVGILSPLPLEIGKSQQYSESFRLTSSKEYPYILQTKKNDNWVSIYGFTETPVDPKEYTKIDLTNREPLHKQSFFREFFICTKPFKMEDKNGRYRIFNDDFIIYKDNQEVHREKIEDQPKLQSLMRQYFGIDLKDHYIRHKELDLKSYLVGVRRPPILHSYPTRYKEKYCTIAKELDVPLEFAPRIKHG